MKNKYKNNADAIKYLSILQDREAQKPVEEMDCELISSCVKILLNLQGKKVSLTEKEIEEKVRKISFAESSDNVKEFKVNKNARTKTTQRRILLIAAVIAILVAILSFVSVAFEWDIRNVIKENFGSILNVPVAVEQNINDETFINNGENRVYTDINEFVKHEKTFSSLLLPGALPDNCKIAGIMVYGSEVVIKFNDETLSLSITKNGTVPLYLCDSQNAIKINNISCYVEELDDINLVQIHFENKDMYYKLTSDNKQILLDIIENLEEKEWKR